MMGTYTDAIQISYAYDEADKYQPEKTAQCQRTCRLPCNSAFGIQSFEISNQKKAKMDARNQIRASHLRHVKFGTGLSHQAFKLVLSQNSIKALIKRVSPWDKYYTCRNLESFLSFVFSISNCHGHYFNGKSPLMQYDSSYVL